MLTVWLLLQETKSGRNLFKYVHHRRTFQSCLKEIRYFIKNNLFLAPVVITSQTHQPVGAPTAYPVHTGGPGVMQSNYNASAAPAMPMPYTDNTPYPTGPPMGTYPTGGNAPYPPAPYGQQQTAMYPPAPSGPYPPAASGNYPPSTAPYPQQAMMNPPPYNEVVFSDNHQKQAPYNPNFTG